MARSSSGAFSAAVSATCAPARRDSVKPAAPPPSIFNHCLRVQIELIFQPRLHAFTKSLIGTPAIGIGSSDNPKGIPLLYSLKPPQSERAQFGGGSTCPQDSGRKRIHSARIWAPEMHRSE